MTYGCPVCGYRMPFPAEDYNICSCCGTEFGYDDAARNYTEIALLWTERGAKWFSSFVKPPRNWNPWLQMINAGLSYHIPWLSHVRVSSTVRYVNTLTLEKDDRPGVGATVSYA
jgi:hypothetical protein